MKYSYVEPNFRRYEDEETKFFGWAFAVVVSVMIIFLIAVFL